jgi:hypothetical protein
VSSSADFDFAAFDSERLMQGHRLEVFDRHLPGQGYYMMQLVYLAHGVVEDAGDDAAVGVAGRAGVTAAEAEAADEGLAGFVEDELQAHALGIVHAADEAVVLLHFDVAGVVALGLAGHGMILTDERRILIPTRLRAVGYFEVPNKSTHTRNAITTVPDTVTRNAKVPIAMPIQ